jgi:hypothetical protein
MGNIKMRFLRRRSRFDNQQSFVAIVAKGTDIVNRMYPLILIEEQRLQTMFIRKIHQNSAMNTVKNEHTARRDR